MRSLIDDYSLRLDDAIKRNTSLEMQIENHEVNTARQVDKHKLYNRKLNEQQKKISELHQSKKDLEERLKATDTDRVRLNDKWVRLAAKQRI